MKYTFSGHDKFHCRPFWLKKGYDHVKSGGKFNDAAVLSLGVGRNMVNAVRHWLRAFDLLDESDNLTKIADFIFADGKGKDPYLEDEGTLWLLHYLINSRKYASIYNLIFGELRKKQPEFGQRHFLNLVSSRGKFNDSTVKFDFDVFLRNYRGASSKDLEDQYSGILQDLQLVESVNTGEREKRYKIDSKERPEIPPHIILFGILQNEKYGSAISLEQLLIDPEDVGVIFALSKDGLFDKVQEIVEVIPGVSYIEDAGIKQIQFKKKKPDPFKILEQYYKDALQPVH